MCVLDRLGTVGRGRGRWRVWRVGPVEGVSLVVVGGRGCGTNLVAASPYIARLLVGGDGVLILYLVLQLRQSSLSKSRFSGIKI